MMMPSGSLLPERDAHMRATASAGDRRVDVSGRSSLRYIPLRHAARRGDGDAVLPPPPRVARQAPGP
jgi:hypothetical protein